MGNTKFTLVELHLDGDTQFGLGSLGTSLPIGSTDEPEEETPTDETEDETEDEAAAADDDGSGGTALGVLVVLAVLVGVGVAVRKFRGDDEETIEEEREQPDIVVN